MPGSVRPTGGGVLSREQIMSAIEGAQPLLRGYLDLPHQLQPNGFDLTLAEINALGGGGSVGVDNADRVLPELEPLTPSDSGWWQLGPGQYQVLYNEIVALPQGLMALGRPRSSLNRCGVTIHTAVWDAGYEGRSTSLMQVLNPAGFRVQRNARVTQLVFLTLASDTVEGYRGVYHGENLNPGAATSE
jgi:dUTP pyrophosphatase